MPEAAPRSRARARDLAIFETLLASGGLQVAIVLSAILSLPFVTRVLSTSEYGVLATITGFVALLGFADLGVGSALTQRLAAAKGREDDEDARGVLSTALAVGACASVLVAILGVTLALVLPWRDILGADDVAQDDIRAAMICTALVTGLSVIGSLGQRVLYGVLRGRTANQWLVVGTVAGALALVLAAVMNAPLYAFVLAGTGVPALLSLLCTYWAVTHSPELPRPAWRSLNRAEFRALTTTGAWFFVIALFSAIGYQTDALIVAGLLGASAAGVFSVANRVFGLVLQGLYPALLQLWPALSDAYSRGDLAWMRSRLRWAIALAGIFSLVSGGLLIVVGRPLISLWLTDELVPSLALLVSLACWTAYSLASAPVMLLLNATGRVRAHALMAAAVGIANLPLSIVLTQQMGIVGPVIGSLVANICFAGIPGLIIARGILTETDLISDAQHRARSEQRGQ